jgi:polyhydroxyalkanoate synthesis regulator phasin
MAWTAAEEARIVAIEEMLNSIQTAITNLASKQQMKQLIYIRQSEMEALTARVTSLEAEVATLQGQIG